LLGAERVLLELARDLISDHGIECLVVFPSPGPLIAEFAQIGALCVTSQYGYWCSPWPPPDVFKDIRESIQAFERTAMPAIREFEPDVVWTQTMIIPWGAMAAARLNKPHVWYVTEYGERDHGAKFYLSTSPGIAREIVESSDLVYTCSKSVAQTLFRDCGVDRVRVLYCHVEAPSEIDPIGSRLFTIPDAVKLGIFSQIIPSKGQEDIVQAMAQLTARGRNLELAIVGGGLADYQARLTDLARQCGIEDRVKFTGFVKAVYPLLQDVDVAVICSRAEAFGRVGVEAMLLGKPTIYPNSGGITEYMIEGETGFSYQPGNVDQLVEVLDRLIGHRAQWPRMGSVARERALALFGKDQFSGEAYRTLQRLGANGRQATAMPKSIESFVADVRGATNRNAPCPCGSGKRYKHCHGRLV